VLFGFGKPKNLVGLDIGSSAIKLVELKESKGSFSLEKMGIEYLSSEAIVDGAIMDAALVVDNINRLIGQTGVKNANFGTSVSGHSVIVKKISLPAMTPEELSESIQWEAEQYIPFDINDVNLDYVLLDRAGEGADTMDVLLVAVKKDKINDYTSVISQTGRMPMLVDVDAFAVQNAFEVNYDIEPDRVVALANLGASVTNVNILQGPSTIFWRDISIGGNQYTDAVQRELHLPREQAESLKKGEPTGEYTLQSILPILNSVSEDVANELGKTLDFFAATSNTERVSKLFICGGCARVHNIEHVLHEKFGFDVEILNPFKNISYNESEFNPETISELAPAMTVAVGLASRKIGD
jgi:type IV pilus assembly protein PilM